MVSDTLLFWYSRFQYRLIKLDLVTAEKCCFHFSRVLGSVVDCLNVDPGARVACKHAVGDAQNMCAVTKVGTVLKRPVFPRGWPFKKRQKWDEMVTLNFEEDRVYRDVIRWKRTVPVNDGSWTETILIGITGCREQDEMKKLKRCRALLALLLEALAV